MINNIRILSNKKVKVLIICLLIVFAFSIFKEPTYAANGNVSGVIQSAWTSAEGQIKNVVNNVIFPCLDLVLAVFFFVKLGTMYFEYKRQGELSWQAPAILFACLCFTLTAPNFIWNIL